MALVLKRLYHGYFWIFQDLADKRSDDIFVVSSPLVPLSIILGYLYFVEKLGPKFMENRKPFDILNIIRVFNVIQIFANSYVAIITANAVYNMNWRPCGVVDYTDNPVSKQILHAAYVFYAIKVLDLLDTVFFILRKSYRQVTFLHVYHHWMMVLAIWIGCKYLPGGESIWIGLINSIVHVVMYLYYLLATIDDKWRAVKYKKMLTQLQLAQFMTFIVIYSRLLFKSDCTYPKWVSFAFIPQNVLMLCMFGEFYVKAYMRSNKNK